MFWKRRNESSETELSPEEAFPPPRTVSGTVDARDPDVQKVFRFHELTTDPVGFLATWKPKFESALPGIANKLLEQLRSDAYTWKQVEASGSAPKAESAARSYLLDFFSGKISPSYVEKRQALGRFCAEHDIDPALHPALAEKAKRLVVAAFGDAGAPVELQLALADALSRLLAVDQGLMVQAYRQAMIERGEAASKEVGERRDQFLLNLAKEIREAARVGDLTSRSDLSRFPGAFRDAVQSVNDLLDSILVPLRASIEVLQAVKRRDLTQRIEGTYTGDHQLIPDALNPALDDLSEALRQVASTVVQVEYGARKMADSSQALSAGATQQASSLEQIRSTVDVVTEQTKRNAESASAASDLATTAHDHADNGNSQMGRMLDAMKGIQDAANEISRIIKVIDEIAFQTNLLSLNAAVEAARAGVHGKGFAVVADEVRSLAGRSAKAAKETAELIEGAISRVRNGVEIATSTADALQGIVEAVKKVTGLIKEIDVASREQARGIEQVNDALGQIESVTQNNAANAEEGAAVAQELSAEAVTLKSLITRFKITGVNSGTNGQRRAPFAPNRIGGQRGTKSLPAGRAANPVNRPGNSPLPNDIADLDDLDLQSF